MCVVCHNMPAFQKNKTTKPSDSPQTPEAVLTTTFLKIRRRLQIISASILGNDTEAEDALSEAFLRLWKHPQCVESSQQAEAVLTKTVRNLSIDEVRKRRSHPTADWEQVSNQQFTSEEEDEVDEITLRLQRIEKLMDECLSPVQQQVLRMRDVDGRTYAEIAQHLNMQETAVRMQLSRARKHLRELYRQQYPN